MLQLKHLALYCGFLAILACQLAAQEEPVTTTVCPNSDDDGPDRDGDLCENFQLIRDLIDPEVLANLIQSHYQCDSKFRKALCYYNTSRFHLVIEQLQQSEAYATLLDELRTAGVNTSAIDKIADIFDCIVLPLNTTTIEKCDCRAVRGHSFIGDVLAAMPHQQVSDYSYTSSVRNTNFGIFRETITSPQFQAKLRSNLLKRDVVRALRVLRRNGWDLPELLRGTMSMLSW
ncbi:uncharacterized protein LOC132790140 [Drosophila nasuta]|uniref:Uncharacterized protein LOC117568235 n=1 Tax=Drosophila albomicans TaxID=7291 RepID=A0A6P8WLS0_DROAB|nr:uncharacterized protein LOC117568235 [Drosophila albomicans]XP_060654566.1 uncharacterized protein LOC132790140 [Drosophila nasuta]